MRRVYTWSRDRAFWVKNSIFDKFELVGRYLKNLLVNFVQTKIFLPFIISLSKRCLGFLIQCFFHGVVDLQKSRVPIFYEKN